MSDIVRMQVRLPVDLASYLEEVSKVNLTSRNAEIVRAVRERMHAEKARGEVPDPDHGRSS